jgi:hypothetical protein
MFAIFRASEMPYPFQYSYYADDTRATMTYPSGSNSPWCRLTHPDGPPIRIVAIRDHAKPGRFWPGGMRRSRTSGHTG